MRRVREPPALIAGVLFLVLALMMALAALAQGAGLGLYGLALVNAVAGGFFLARAFRGPPRAAGNQHEEL